MKVFEKDGDIYVEYNVYVYPAGDTQVIKKFKKEEMNYIEWEVGPKGGDHGWNIKGFKTNECPTSVNGRYYKIGERFETIKGGEFWRGRTDIMDELVKLTGLEVKEVLDKY